MENSWSNERGDRGRTTAISHFNDALRLAIEAADGPLIAASLDSQEVSEVTINISNHFLLRSFLLDQKGKLVELMHKLPTLEGENSVSRNVNGFLHQLDEQFNDVFAVEDTEYPYTKLSGDRLFRDALSLQNDNLPEIARYIAEIDPEGLLVPEEVFDLADVLVDDIYKAVNGAMDAFESGNVGERDISVVVDEITRQIEEFDTLLLNKHSDESEID